VVSRALDKPAAGSRGVPVTTKALVKTEPAAVKGGKAAKTKKSIRTWLFRGTGAGKEFDLKDLPRLSDDNKNMAWVDLAAYDEADLNQIAGLLKLHPVAVEAALAPWQRPRIDTFGTFFFLSVTLVEADVAALRVKIGELDLFMGRNFLVTAHRQDLPFLDRVVERVHKSPELVRYHTAFVLYIVLDEMIDFYMAQYEELEEQIEKVEETALRDDSDTFLSDLLRLKRYVFLLGRLAEQHKTVFAALTRPDFDFVSGNDVQPYFKDLQQRLSQFVDRLFAAREAVNGAFDIYVSRISHRTNITMKLLTVVSTVLLPATLIVGFFGTGFWQLHNQTSLDAMLVLLVAVPAAVLFALRRAHLI
jgi:magnesium transporter